MGAGQRAIDAALERLGLSGKEEIAFSNTDNYEMEIGASDYAVSTKGMKDYIDNLKAELIDSTYEKLKDIEPIREAVDKGWNGPAKRVFLEKLAEAINAVYADMEDEHRDLLARLAELETAYLKQNYQISQTMESQN